MGKAKKYEYENLIPIHQELAKKVFFNFMKISMVVLAILGIGVLIGVDSKNMASQARKVESFEAYGNDPSCHCPHPGEEGLGQAGGHRFAYRRCGQACRRCLEQHRFGPTSRAFWWHKILGYIEKIVEKVQKISTTLKHRSWCWKVSWQMHLYPSPLPPTSNIRLITPNILRGTLALDAMALHAVALQNNENRPGDCYGKRKSGGVYSVSYELKYGEYIQ